MRGTTRKKTQETLRRLLGDHMLFFSFFFFLFINTSFQVTKLLTAVRNGMATGMTRKKGPRDVSWAIYRMYFHILYFKFSFIFQVLAILLARSGDDSNGGDDEEKSVVSRVIIGISVVWHTVQYRGMGAEEMRGTTREKDLKALGPL